MTLLYLFLGVLPLLLEFLDGKTNIDIIEENNMLYIDIVGFSTLDGP